jgi:hypothetical protein
MVTQELVALLVVAQVRLALVVVHFLMLLRVQQTQVVVAVVEVTTTTLGQLNSPHQQAVQV